MYISTYPRNDVKDNISTQVMNANRDMPVIVLNDGNLLLDCVQITLS
jgi:hypothetical protein